MKSLWCDDDAKSYINDPLSARVYTSRLLGKESSLVLHGGGNTSVKTRVVNIFGDSEDILYVKGSGWDLASIEAPGFAPVRMETLLKLARLDELSDAQMVKEQRSAMIDPTAPTPSVEAILHALIPYQFVDHTHADAIVTITNTENGEQAIRQLFGERVLVIPYVMPGFILAKKIYQLTENVDWQTIDGLVLMHHGVFSFADDAKLSYERMIDMVTKAENYIAKMSNEPSAMPNKRSSVSFDSLDLARIRKQVSTVAGKPLLAKLDNSADNTEFAHNSNVVDICTRGPLTPDHVIRTKRVPMILNEDIDHAVTKFAADYESYFNQNSQPHHICLDKAPRWALWPGESSITFGSSVSETQIIADIVKHTMKSIVQAEQLGGWRALPAKDIFDVEYWELEQAKLKKSAKPGVFQGKVALVTGAASGIGKACAEMLQSLGAAVIAIDLANEVTSMFQNKAILGLKCDVTESEEISIAVEQGIATFGGIDIVVSNAGTFPSSHSIKGMPDELWSKSLNTNLTSHQKVLSATVPYLELGIDPAVVIIGSKNVPAPGPGASAYSAAKAGLTQLARIAALELAENKIRVNVVHPNAVFDTAIWTDEILDKRASHYGISVQEYKSNNLLKLEVTSNDVASLVCAMAGPSFAKTTGAQVAIDGGNERVI